MLKTNTNSVLKNVYACSSLKNLVAHCYTHQSIEQRVRSLREFNADKLEEKVDTY